MRVEGWKEIAAYFGRTVRTIQRWECEQELPIRRHLHASGATVYAYGDELAEWRALRTPALSAGDDGRTIPTSGESAHVLYLMSRYHWAQRTRDGFEKSIALARTALQRDPCYAPAHAALALAYATRASYGHALPEGDVRLAKECATTALRLDATVIEAHQALGFIRLCFEWNWPLARTAFEDALRLNPFDATTHQWFSLWHLANKADDEACATARHAEGLDPNSLILAAHSAWMLHQTGRLDEAVTKARSVIRRNPHFWRGYFNLALSLAAMGHLREAAEAIEVAAALNDQTNLDAVLAHALARSGQTDRARATMARFEAAGTYLSPYWQAYAAIGFGCEECALQRLGESVSNREWFVLFLTHEPAFAQLRTLPAFDDLRRAVGLP